MTQENGSRSPKPPPVDRLSQLWRRVNEHKMVQWCVAYIAVAYAVQHAVVLTGEAFEWPPAVLRVSMLLMVLGLPIVLALAWYHGERASRHFSPGELTIISLLLVIGSVVFYAFVQPHQEVATDHALPVQQAGVEAARAAAASPGGGVSLAVLPFSNLSGDPSQGFFSDGMTVEITAALAKIPDLRVVSRESAFQFKDEKKDMRSVGQALGATHLIEGAVRKDGTRLRITVQLINAANGVSIRTESYDRQLTDVFAVQEDIARAITASLNMSLPLKPGENLVTNRAIDADSYEKYLRAGALLRTRLTAPENLQDAVSLLEEVVAKNPGYAPAWAVLGVVNFFLATALAGDPNEPIAEVRARVNELREKGEGYARRAIELDPNSALGYASLLTLTWAPGRFVEAEDYFMKAQALDPAAGLFSIGIRFGAAGRLKEALAVTEKAHAFEPNVPNATRDTAVARWLNGQNEAAIALARTLPPGARAPLLAMIYASMDRYSEAADALMEISSDPNSDAAKAARLLRTAPAKASAPDTLPRLPQTLEFVYLHVGAPERAIATYERRAEVGFSSSPSMAFVWHPSYAPVRKTERFKALMRKFGFIDYWRVKGWPEFCHPTTGDDFECA